MVINASALSTVSSSNRHVSQWPERVQLLESPRGGSLEHAQFNMPLVDQE